MSLFVAVVEFLVHQNYGEAVSIAHNLWRSVKLRSWGESGGATSLHQIEGIDMQISTSLEYLGVRTLRQLAHAQPEKLTKFVHKDIKVCSSLINKAASIADFFATMSTLMGTMRVVVKTKPHPPSAGESGFKQTCTLLVWGPEKILLYHEGVEPESTFDVQLPESLRESSRLIYVRLFHDQFAGMDERFDVPLEEDVVQTCQASRSMLKQPDAKLQPPAEVIPARNLPIRAGYDKANERHLSPPNQDSKLLREIKELERHQKTAKQQSIFQFLRRIPESEAFGRAIHRDHQQSDDFKQQKMTTRDEISRQSDYAMARIPDVSARTKLQTCNREVGPRGEKVLSTKIPENVVHAITSDEDNTYSASVGAKVTSKQATASGRDSHTKRKAAEDLFAHFRFTKRSAVDGARTRTSKITAQGTAGSAKPSKARKTNPNLTASRSVAPFGSSREVSKSRSRSTKTKTTEEPVPLNPLDVVPCSIRSTPFFQSFVREKVNHAAWVFQRELQKRLS